LIYARRRTNTYVFEREIIVDGEVTYTRINNVKHGFATAAVRAGFGRFERVKAPRKQRDGKEVCEKRPHATITRHALRHTCITWLLRGDKNKPVEIEEVAAFVGATAETIGKIYGHHHPRYQKAAAAALD
jgi:integrase